MKRFGFIIVIIYSLTVTSSFSQNVDSLYEIATWQGFSSAAISFTFDDGYAKQYSIAEPIFDKYNFKITFFPVINWGPDWTALQKAANKGHEVGSHTVSHPQYGSIDQEQQNFELSNSINSINSHISGQNCITMAYPYCQTGDDSITGKYFLAARICSGQIVSKTPSNFMRISSFVCGSLGINSVAEYFRQFNSAANSRGWVVLLIHDLDDSGYSPVNSSMLETVVDSLGTFKDKFWVSSFGNVARYIKERNSVNVSELSLSDSVITVSITDSLDNSIYNIPVSVRRQLPFGWASATVMQNGDTLTSSIKMIDSLKYIIFDAVPDEGDIQIKNAVITDVENSGISKPETGYLMQNFPNPFNPETTIKYRIVKSSFVKLEIFDSLGRRVSTLVNSYQLAGNYRVNFNAADLTSGIYFYRLSGDDFSFSKKMSLLK